MAAYGFPRDLAGALRRHGFALRNGLGPAHPRLIAIAEPKLPGDRIAARPPETLSDTDGLVLDVWRAADADDRHRLAQLFMRTVGHEEFLDSP